MTFKMYSPLLFDILSWIPALTLYSPAINSTGKPSDVKLNSQFVDVFPVELIAGEYKVNAGIQDKISNKSLFYIVIINS